METESYNSRLTPPRPPSAAPAHLLHADKRSYESIVTNCRGNCCGRLCLAGMIHSDKRRGLLLNCVNLMSRQHFRIKPATRTVESGGSGPPAAQMHRRWWHAKHKTAIRTALQTGVDAGSINFSVHPEPQWRASPINSNTCMQLAIILNEKEKMNRCSHPVYTNI